MAITGHPGGAPVASPASALAMLGEVTEQLAQATRISGKQVCADPPELITGRAALMGFTRRGLVSAGGSSFLLRTADGWCAVTLSRRDDLASIPAILGALGQDGAKWDAANLDSAGPATDLAAKARTALAAAALARSAEDLMAAAQLLGVPAAVLPSVVRPGAAPSAPDWPPWRASRIAPPSAGVRLAGAVVVDLSSMWAGPLCARLLGLAGADVIKVESPDRPDGARSGNREFFDWLHAGHRSLAVDFRTGAGRAALAALLDVADVVIEASRPRALAALGLAPDMVLHRDGKVWLSITGYGRAMPDRVAFGDDAAVAGGLVGWTSDRPTPEPVFCADAIADPLTGVCGALAVARSLAAGGGELIDLPMREVAAAFAAAPASDHGPHEVQAGRTVACPRLHRAQAVLPPRHPTSPEAHATELGADVDTVLAWLTTRQAARRSPC